MPCKGGNSYHFQPKFYIVISWTIFYAMTVRFFKKSLLSQEFWIGNSRIQISSNSQMQPRSKLFFFENTLCHDIGNSKLHNVRKPGAAEGRIAMWKSRNSNFRKYHVTPCKKGNSYRFQLKSPEKTLNQS